MRVAGVVLAAATALVLGGCNDEPNSLGTTTYAIDPMCDLGDITVDGVTYLVVGVENTGSYTPAPEPTMGVYPRDGTLERFDDGTATWTGNGYELRFDSNSEVGKYQVC